MLTLYHSRTSVCAVKVRLVLAEKNLPWDSKLLALDGDQFDPEYRRLNPNAVVPTLVHNGRTIIDSTVIMHYVDDVFPDPALMPADPLLRTRMRATTKLIDEYIHNACTVFTFATANRARLLAKSAAELEQELSRTPNRTEREAKAHAVKYGLDGPSIVHALSHFRKLLDLIAGAAHEQPFIAGNSYSIADAAATPYIWRLEKLKLSELWRGRAEIADWYQRVRERASFAKAVTGWLSAADIARYDAQPDPWPKVSAILAGEAPGSTGVSPPN